MEDKNSNNTPEKNVDKKAKMSVDEKRDLILETISKGKYNVKSLSAATGIVVPTLYRILAKLKDKVQANKEGFYEIIEEDEFDKDKIINDLLGSYLLSVSLKRTPVVKLKQGEVEEDSTQTYIKMIIVELMDSGFEKMFADYLYRKFYNEITLVSVGVGGVIVYLRIKKKSKVYAYLRGLLLESSDE